MAKIKFDYDVIIIGAGAAGSVAAEVLVRRGRRVAIVEQSNIGGTAVTLDIPLSAFQTAAHEFDRTRRSAAFGLRTNTLGYNFPSVKNWQNLVLRRSGALNSEKYFKNLGIDVFRGRAHFLSSHEISIARRHLSAEKFIVATGSTTVETDITGINHSGVLTPETILDLTRPPKTLFVIGGGFLAAQLAEVFAIFGTKVILADTKKRILSEADDEVSELFAEVFTTARGMEILTSTRVVSLKRESMGWQVNYLTGEKETAIKVEHVLLATDRRANTDLGLDNAGVEFTEDGILVADNLQTNVKNIFAAGDVLGEISSPQTAIAEGRVAAAGVLGLNAVAKHDASPQIWRLSPEVATAGLNEFTLTRHNEKFKKSVVKNATILRANATDNGVGFAKILTDSHGVIVGGTIVSPAASETIQELSLAISTGLTAKQLAEIPHTFDSWSEALRLAAAQWR
jgi:pyruvate/2-oxoglutarate dehydrogenase complex dihydrolipoamide dehydrogenase (E3) component